MVRFSVVYSFVFKQISPKITLLMKSYPNDEKLEASNEHVVTQTAGDVF